jgi:energy-coupling factor transporter transmembrane protein EcfT
VDPEQDFLTLAVLGTGVFVAVGPTPIQVLWLLVLAGVLVAQSRFRSRGFGGPANKIGHPGVAGSS